MDPTTGLSSSYTPTPLFLFLFHSLGNYSFGFMGVDAKGLVLIPKFTKFPKFPKTTAQSHISQIDTVFKIGPNSIHANVF